MSDNLPEGSEHPPGTAKPRNKPLGYLVHPQKEDATFRRALDSARERHQRQLQADTQPDTPAMTLPAADTEKQKREHAPSPSFWTTLVELFRGPRLAFVVITIAAVVVGVFVLRPTREKTIRLALRDSERAGAVSLPKNFELNIEKRSLRLFEGADQLAGRIEPLTGQTVSPTLAFSATLLGKDSVGIEGRFRGTLWITNAAGVIALKRSADVAGARLQGVFEIGGQSTNAVDQVFVP